MPPTQAKAISSLTNHVTAFEGQINTVQESLQRFDTLEISPRNQATKHDEDMAKILHLLQNPPTINPLPNHETTTTPLPPPTSQPTLIPTHTPGLLPTPNLNPLTTNPSTETTNATPYQPTLLSQPFQTSTQAQPLYTIITLPKLNTSTTFHPLLTTRNPS